MTQLELGLEAKRIGKLRAAKHHGIALELARQIARDLALRHGTVTADDVRVVYERWHPSTPMGNAWGSLFNDGHFIPDGFVPSTQPSRHGAIIRQWRLK